MSIKLSKDRIGECFTLRDALNYGEIISAAMKKSKVQWITEENGDLQKGTVRYLCDENGNFLNADDDIRDAFVRITTTLGWEKFIPMKEAAALVRKTYMVFNP